MPLDLWDSGRVRNFFLFVVIVYKSFPFGSKNEITVRFVKNIISTKNMKITQKTKIKKKMITALKKILTS